MPVVIRSVQIATAAVGAITAITAIVSIACSAATFFNAVDIAPAQAQGVSEAAAGELLTAFKATCYDLMPDIAAAEKHATSKGWEPLTGMALRMQSPDNTAKRLLGWKATVGSTKLTVSIAVTEMDPEMATSIPDFAKSDVYGCSVTAAANVDHDVLGADLAQFIGRKADETTEADSPTGNVWAGTSTDLAVFVTHYWPKRGGKGINMLSRLAIPK